MHDRARDYFLRPVIYHLIQTFGKKCKCPRDLLNCSARFHDLKPLDFSAVGTSKNFSVFNANQLLTVRVRVALLLTVSELVCLRVEPTLWTFDLILLLFQEFGSGICFPVSVGRPLWREAESVLWQSTHLSVCIFTIYTFVFHTFTIYIYTHIYIHTYIYI
jgi:hypothetical protein